VVINRLYLFLKPLITIVLSSSVARIIIIIIIIFFLMSNKGEREGERLLMNNTYKCVPKSRVGKTG
jgi:hypothetical protein